MSIENITKQNFKDLYCKNLNVSGIQTVANMAVKDLTIPDDGTLNFTQGSKINGYPDFGNTSTTNFSNGSKIEGVLQFANGATIVTNGGTTTTVNGNLILGGTTTINGATTVNNNITVDDEAEIVTTNGTTTIINGSLNLSSAQVITLPSVTRQFIWMYSSSSGGEGTTPILTFYKMGRMIFVNIPPFSKEIPDLNPSTSFIGSVDPPAAPLPDDFTPLMETAMTCMILNKNIIEIGTMVTLPNQTFELSPVTGGFTVDGTSGLLVAMTITYVSAV